MLALISMRGAPPDTFAWFIVAFIAGVGGCLGGAVVLAFINVRRSPAALLKALVFLSAISLLVLVPHGADAFRARRFLAHADSAQGVVSRRYHRGGKHLWVSYVAGDRSGIVSDRARRSTFDLQVGDTAWVFVDATVPARATIGRPGPDWTSAFRTLAQLWAVSGVLFLGYGVSATPAGLPQRWRSPVRLVRAYLGAAAMADVGFALVMVLHWDLSDLRDPRHEVARAFEEALFFGGLFSLFFTLVLGSLALLVLRERRWTSDFAYAMCGIAFGSVGGLTVGPAGLLVGSVSGLLAGLAFRWLYFWGGDPSGNAAAGAEQAFVRPQAPC
jgi:hypothetical protein